MMEFLVSSMQAVVQKFFPKASLRKNIARLPETMPFVWKQHIGDGDTMPLQLTDKFVCKNLHLM